MLLLPRQKRKSRDIKNFAGTDGQLLGNGTAFRFGAFGAAQGADHRAIFGNSHPNIGGPTVTLSHGSSSKRFLNWCYANATGLSVGSKGMQYRLLAAQTVAIC